MLVYVGVSKQRYSGVLMDEAVDGHNPTYTALLTPAATPRFDAPDPRPVLLVGPLLRFN